MKNITALCGMMAACVGATGSAMAGGVDRSGQPLSILFEKGNYVELSYGQINPRVTGTDNALPGYAGGVATGNVAGRHSLPGLSLKYDFTEQLSAAIVYDQAYGADIYYANPLAGEGGTPLIGGTRAILNSDGLTALLRYKFNDALSVHGGLRASRADAQVTLSGNAYRAPDGSNGLNGYNVDFGRTWGTGYVLGAAFEKPEIGMRVALTYFSKVSHDMDTQETIGGVPVAAPSVTTIDTPQAVNLDLQSGVAKDTLVFGSIRWVDWSDFKIEPAFFNGATGRGLVALEDSTTYTLGVGRKFNDNWSGSVFVTYEPGGNPNVSPLAPTNGYKGIGLAAVYTRDNMKITMGARYLDLGNAMASPGGVPVAAMQDNHAVALGLKVGFTF